MRIAVIVPARNAEGLLADCIAAVRDQTLPPDQIYVAVAPSTDGTDAVARRLIDDSTTIVENPSGDRGSGINAAVSLASADAVAMVDAQCRIAADYLEQAARALRETTAGVVGGPMRPVGRTPIGQAMALALRSPFGVGNSQFHFEGAMRDVESVYLGVYRSEVFATVGRYNSALLRTEDDDFNARVRDAGFRIVLDPMIRSEYLCRNTIAEIWRQYFGYGYWKIALLAARPSALRARHFAPALFVVALIGAAVTSAVAWSLALPILVGAWLVGAIIAAAAVRGGSAAARLLMPVVALTMHLGYGVGSLLGLAALPSVRERVVAGARAAGAVDD